MLFSFLLITFVILAATMAAIMQRLPDIWTIRGYKIPAWLFYAPWGIGWIVTGFALTGLITWTQWAQLWLAFVLCYPLICWGAYRPDKSVEAEFAKLRKAIEDIEKSIHRGYLFVWRR